MIWCHSKWPKRWSHEIPREVLIQSTVHSTSKQNRTEDRSRSPFNRRHWNPLRNPITTKHSAQRNPQKYYHQQTEKKNQKKEKGKPQPNQNTICKYEWHQRQNHKPASSHRQPKQSLSSNNRSKRKSVLWGYAPWYHRPKGEGDGSGVAITVCNDLKQNSQLADDIEDNNNQEIISIQINLNSEI